MPSVNGQTKTLRDAQCLIGIKSKATVVKINSPVITMSYSGT